MLLIRALRNFLPLLAFALFAGCVQVEQTLSLDANGGGTVTVQYAMSKEALANLEARARAESGDSDGMEGAPFSFDEAQVREDFKEYEPLGITLEEVRSWEEGGNKYIRLAIRFASLADVMKTEFFSDRNVQLKRLADGAYEFRQTGAPPEDMTPETMEMMRGLLAGFRAALAVETPGPILETNADEHGERKATWIFDVDKDPEALARAQRMDLWVRFAVDGVSLPEYPAP